MSPLAYHGRPKKRERRKALMGKGVEFLDILEEKIFWEVGGRKEGKKKEKEKGKEFVKEKNFEK